MENDFLKDLNTDQQEAVKYSDGPAIILAGAGSGKTRVLTYKVLYLSIQKQISPNNILMVTFTNKAATEMRERVGKKLAELSLTKGEPTIATFHSLCAKILRKDGKHIGIPASFIIYDSQDQEDVVKEILKKLDVSPKQFKPSSLLATISQAKNELVDELSYASLARGQFQDVVSRVYPLYQKTLKENGALDFDDLISKTIFLFKNHPETLEKYQQNYVYILIDEYQDTNNAQFELTKLLARKHNTVSVVGDFSQSIYSWRGADYRNLMRFKDAFPNVKTFSLSQNYRSTQKILDAASSVITNNSLHPVLSLWTENKKGEEVTLFEAIHEHSEAQFIIGKIVEKKLQDKNLSHGDFAVLYRTNAQSRVLEEAFLHHGVPYILIGGTRFYERKEVKDVLSYLRLLYNSRDTVSQKRIEKLGKARLGKFDSFKKSIDAEQKTTIELLDGVVKQTEYLSLYDEDNEEDRQRLENIKELRSVAIEFPHIGQFLENVSLVEQEYIPNHVKESDKKNAVTLMTLHAAKGLEFKIVFMVGMEEGLFPHSRSVMDKHQLEEERRLCYVGMTRAREKLFLTYARRRLFFGQKTSSVVSRFILELPNEIVSKNLGEIPLRKERSEFL